MTISPLRLRPWWRGPFLLLRRPGVVVALAAAAFVAALPAAAAPLFLSSAQDATLHHQLAAGCPWTTGLQLRSAVNFGPTPILHPNTVVARHDILMSARDLLGGRRQKFAAATAGARGLTAPVSTTVDQLDISPAGASQRVTLVSRTDFEKHITVLATSGKPGLWLPDTVAAPANLRPGDTVQVGDPDRSARANLPVAGVFADLRGGADKSFWCSLDIQINGVRGQEFSNDPLFPVALVDEAALFPLGDALGGRTVAQWTEYAVAAPQRITTGDAERLAAEVSTAVRRLRADDRHFAWDEHQDTVASRLADVVRRAHLVYAGLLPPVVPITAAGTLVGLLVVAAAAVFWVRRRRTELRVLAVHGASPGSLGVKAVAESLPALVVGALAGLGCGWLLVALVGPAARLSTAALPRAVLAATAAAVAAVVTIGAVAAVRCRSLTDELPPHRRLRAYHVPWELGLLGAAAVGWALLSGETDLADDPAQGVGSVTHVPARLLIVPILAISGLVPLAARAATAWLRRRSANRTPYEPAALLAWRRLGRDAVGGAVLAAATAIPIALAVYGAAVTGSVRDTSAAEARLVVGSDLVATLAAPAPVPAPLAGRATAVVRVDGVIAGGVKCDVLIVDRATFATGAFWADRIGGPTLSAVTARLDATHAVGSGVLQPGDTTLTLAGDQMAAVSVTHTALLPAAAGGYPVLLLDRRTASPRLVALGVPQIWVRGPTGPALTALAAAQVPVRRYTLAADHYAGTTFEPVTYTFGYLIALSLLTGLVTLVGLLLYLESRTLAHRRSYVVLRRMGLRPASHRRALVGELAIPLAGGLGFGLACGYAMANLFSDDFDLNRLAPPSTLIALPVTPAFWITGAVAAVAVGAGAFAHRRITRANPSEVLRDTV